MANYIPTSCTDAYIKINNILSLPNAGNTLLLPAELSD